MTSDAQGNRPLSEEELQELVASSDAGARNPAILGDTPLAPLVFGLTPLPRSRTPAPHPAYTAWSHDGAQVIGRAAMGRLLETRPPGLYRLKGFVMTDDGTYEVHVVGRHVTARRTRAERTTLVGLGLAARITRDEIEDWWQSSGDAAP